jgi:UDP-2,4-diacetamido-2,4,6-trideoxy-beta-L-altropyranose hydrolase
MKVLFRADASFQIGSGHVIRCITLAKALRERGAECRFVFRDHEGNLSEYARKQGFHVDLLPVTDDAETTRGGGKGVTPYGQWLGATQERDAGETIQCLSGTSMDWVIVDHYGIDSQWESRLRQYTKRILVIDDLANRHHDCDVLLDQNLIKDFQCRYDALVPENCAKLLGPEYAILQAEYSDLHTRTPPRLGPVSRILVYFGAADVNNLTALTLEALGDPRFEAIDIDVVVNPQSPNYDQVCRVTTGNSRIHIHEDLPSLAPLMVKADLAIGAAGATSWERCCMGLPAVVVTLAENQVPLAEELHELKVVSWIGESSTLTVEVIRDAVEGYVVDERKVEDCSLICSRIIDGKGADRLANLLSIDSTTELTARRASLSDEALILSWANDRLVRGSGFNPEPIIPEVHRKWFYNRLRNVDGCFFFIVSTSINLPLGQVRFECNKEAWEIHYSLSPVARGRGLGVKLIQTALSEFRKFVRGVPIFGRVKLENIASQKVLESLGFESAKFEDGALIYNKFIT